MAHNFVDFDNCPPHGIKKMGPIIPSELGDMQPLDVIFPMSVIGQFKDYRDFSMIQVQNWVDSCWFTNEDIKVEKVSKTFFFYCTNVNNRDNLM